MGKIVRVKKAVVSGRKMAVSPRRLLGDLRRLIRAARQRTAQFINAELVKLYWNIGARIRTDLLKGRRSGYGDEMIPLLSRELSAEYGPGFGRRNLFYMTRFAEVFPDAKIVHALSMHLSWTHLRLIIAIDDPIQRDFYAQMCRLERWSTRTLEKKISGMLFQRTALSRKPAELASEELRALREEDRMTPDLVFRDPYFLDSWDLKTSTARRTSRRRFCASWSISSWSSGLDSPL